MDRWSIFVVGVQAARLYVASRKLETRYTCGPRLTACCVATMVPLLTNRGFSAPKYGELGIWVNNSSNMNQTWSLADPLDNLVGIVRRTSQGSQNCGYKLQYHEWSYLLRLFSKQPQWQGIVSPRTTMMKQSMIKTGTSDEAFGTWCY